jgi:alanine-glyoxylate transaminase/serine-glyoxylate transaminase/serine-pyruvate transaminase
MDAPTVDHRGPAFQALALDVLELLGRVFGTKGPAMIYAASGSGARQAAPVNTLSPSDTVLAFDTGYFAALWAEMVGKFELVVDVVASDWRHGANPTAPPSAIRTC